MTACPNCASEQKAGAKFCDECGSRMAAACVACRAELRTGAKFCDECGTSQTTGAAQPGPIESPVPAAGAGLTPVAERKVISVLFGDLVGFTPLSEALDKEDVRELLSDYFAQCRRVVARYGGTIEKFIGDAVMAVWGVPAAHDDDAERAVRASLELVRAVESLGEARGLPGLALRVGVVTGEVAVTIGRENEGMVAGDAVNTAARVQSVADPGHVWVDETTRLLTSGAITFVDVGSHRLKGKADPVPLWSVRAVVAAVGGAQRADGLEAPLTGRERELRLVKEVLHGVEDTGRPALVLVNGEPGLGKSRVGWEFEKYVDGMSTPFSWHSTRCLAYGEGVAYWPIAEAVRGRIGLVESDPDDDPVTALDDWLARNVPDADEVAWLRPRLLVLLGRGTTGGYERDDLFAAWRTFFERTREDDTTAVVLLIDDAQHADDGTVHFVEHLLAHSEAPVFVMLLARPDLLQRWPALATNRRATVLHLAALDDKEMAALLDGLVPGMPEEVRRGLVERAQGVPLYAIETVRSLIDRDLVVPRGGVYVLPDPAKLDLAAIGAPASLQALVAARLDGLPPAQRRVVADASVLGMTFTREAIGALTGEPPDLDADLAALTRLEVLSTVTSRLSAEYGQYRFVQPVVRQVAYSTQSRRDRKARHLAVVDHLTRLGDPSGDLAPVLAQNLLDAIGASPDGAPDLPELRSRAVAHLAAAAARARALDAPQEALRHLEVALTHATDDEVAALHDQAAWASFEAGDADALADHGQQALDRYTAIGDDVGAAHVVAAMAEGLCRLRGENQQGLELARPHWAALADRPGVERVRLELASAISLAEVRLNIDPTPMAIKRVELADAVGDPRFLGEALISLGSFFLGSSPSLGRILTKAAVDLGKQAQHPKVAWRGLSNLGILATMDDLGQAIATHHEALTYLRKANMDLEGPLALVNLCIASVSRGDLAVVDEVLPTLPPDKFETVALRPMVDAMMSDITGRPRRFPSPIGFDSDDATMQACVHFGEAIDAHTRGDAVVAAALGERAFDLAFEIVGLSDDLVILYPYVVDAAVDAGDRALVGRLLDVVDQTPVGMLGVALRAHRRRFAALVAIADGRTDTVEADYREAIAGFDAWDSPLHRARAEGELANWLAAQGRLDEAEPLRASATAVLESIGATRWLERLGAAPASVAT